MIEDVPASKTVVGIPGKIVNVNAQVGGDLNPYGVDLNHHLIPDPVADAISCLMERIRVLEKEVARANGIVIGEPGSCPQCDLPECISEDDPLLTVRNDKKTRISSHV